MFLNKIVLITYNQTFCPFSNVSAWLRHCFYQLSSTPHQNLLLQMRATQPILFAPSHGYSHVMLTAALSLLISQYHCVTMAAFWGIYSKRAYSSKLQHRSLVKVKPSCSQTFMSRGALLSLTGEYLIYLDTWDMQYHGKATYWRPLLVAPREQVRGPKGAEEPVWETLIQPLQLQLFVLNWFRQWFRKVYTVLISSSVVLW